MKLRQGIKRVVMGLVIAIIGATALIYLVNNNKARYPEPPLFDSTTNVLYRETLTAGGFQVRTLLLQTIAPTKRILAFYVQELVEDTWEVQEITANQIRFNYINGPNNPAFSLIVTIEERDTMRIVHVQQVMDGPFSAWPKWMNTPN